MRIRTAKIKLFVLVARRFSLRAVAAELRAFIKQAAQDYLIA